MSIVTCMHMQACNVGHLSSQTIIFPRLILAALSEESLAQSVMSNPFLSRRTMTGSKVLQPVGNIALTIERNLSCTLPL